MADESHIRQLRSALTERIKASEEQTKKENREEEIFKAAAPRDWIKLKASLKQSVDEVNEGLPKDTLTYAEDGSKNEVTLRCGFGQKRGELVVKYFDLFGATISMKGNRIDLSYSAEIEGRGIVWTVAPHERISVEEIEKRILTAATSI